MTESESRSGDLRPGETHSEDLRAALRARAELGPEYETAIVDSFAEKLDHAVNARVDAAIRDRVTRRQPSRPVAVPIVSLIAGLLSTSAVANRLEADALPVIILLWVAIAIINVVQYAYDRPRRD